jgi:hypothetical protein
LADAQHLTHGRSRARDRHLNFYETRDKLVDTAVGSVGSEGNSWTGRPGKVAGDQPPNLDQNGVSDGHHGARVETPASATSTVGRAATRPHEPDTVARS